MIAAETAKETMTEVYIRPMTEDDIEFGMSVVAEAGWNQLESDWHRLLRFSPDGCFVANCGGQAAGTVTTTAYGTSLAWIGMMLVPHQFRRRGFGSALMKQAVEHLQSRGVSSIQLDATPVGKSVYQQLGFRDLGQFHRWERQSSHAAVPEESGIQPTGPPVDLSKHGQRDLAAFGADRLEWLGQLALNADVVDASEGFGMIRRGRIANYLGPVVAESPQAALDIIMTLLVRADPGRLFWDIPAFNPAAERIARRLGFEPTRGFTRMWYGKEMKPSQPELQFAIGDPSSG